MDISKAVSKHYRLNIEQQSSEFITLFPPLNSKNVARKRSMARFVIHNTYFLDSCAVMEINFSFNKPSITVEQCQVKSRKII